MGVLGTHSQEGSPKLLSSSHLSLIFAVDSGKHSLDSVFPVSNSYFSFVYSVLTLFFIEVFPPLSECSFFIGAFSCFMYTVTSQISLWALMRSFRSSPLHLDHLCFLWIILNFSL